MSRRKITKETDYRTKTLRFDIMEDEQREAFLFLEKIKWYQTKFIAKCVCQFISDYNVTPDAGIDEIKLLLDYYLSNNEIPKKLQHRNEMVPNMQPLQMQNDINTLNMQMQMLKQQIFSMNNMMTSPIQAPLPMPYPQPVPPQGQIYQQVPPMTNPVITETDSKPRKEEKKSFQENSTRVMEIDNFEEDDEIDFSESTKPKTKILNMEPLSLSKNLDLKETTKKKSLSPVISQELDEEDEDELDIDISEDNEEDDKEFLSSMLKGFNNMIRD